MILPGEIEAVSQTFGIHTSHVQRDYVHGWLLSILYSSSPLGKQLVLKGGNCLRKAYFERTRYSRDLDFSTSTSISDADLGRELNAVCSAVGDRCGVAFDTARTRVEQKVGVDPNKRISEARLYFRDFFGQESELLLGVRLDVTQFDRLYLPIQERHLIHPYSDADACACTIRCVKLEELLATKMRCLLQRRHIADLFDLVYATLIGQELEVDRAELLSVFFRITIFGRNPGIAKGLFVDLPLEALSKFWSSYITCPQQSWFSFETARARLLRLIDSLIPEQAIRERSQILFPSALRNPIMEAGQAMTILRMGYDGVVRLVEPYSLVFKTRKDGVANEYFYAYDITGGRSSGPGIKAFLPGKVESIENTTQPFQPRFEVELRKAGGAETAGSFQGHLGLRGLGYVRHAGRQMPVSDNEIECPYCSRRFKRKAFDNSLRPHQDGHGNPCPGRVGHPVW